MTAPLTSGRRLGPGIFLSAPRPSITCAFTPCCMLTTLHLCDFYGNLVLQIGETEALRVLLKVTELVKEGARIWKWHYPEPAAPSPTCVPRPRRAP